MTPYEYVLSYYLMWSKEFNMSIAEIDETDLELMLELSALQGKIKEETDPENRTYYIDEILG